MASASPGTVRAARVVALAGMACAAVPLAQEEAPLPPRILDDEPGQASLAQVPEGRAEVLEEIVVVATGRWRLPDLGATWRARYEEQPESRVSIRYLPLYDPELADRWPDLFQLSKQEERTGYLELFRFRFGTEAQKTIVPTVLNPDP